MLGGLVGNSTIELYSTIVVILFLRLFTPVCIAYSIYNTVAFFTSSRKASGLLLIFGVIAYAETFFFFLVYLPRRIYLQKDAVHPPPLSRQERRELFLRCNENIPDPEEYMRKWFLGAAVEDIKRENVEDMFLWAFFNRNGPPGDDAEELEEYVRLSEESFKRPFQPGRGSAKSVRLTLDKVDMQHRALLFYMVVASVDFFTYVRLQLAGFQFYRLRLSHFFTLFPLRPVALLTKHTSPVKHLTYWYRPHTSKTRLPIVFMHGIGIGLFPYVDMFNELTQSPGGADSNDQVGIIALEIMPVSFRITHKALGREEMCFEISQIVKNHFGEFQKFVLVSQSYGTVVTTHVLRDPYLSSRIGPIVLMDPVSLLLHLPDIAYNFTRRKPAQANELMLNYFASMDMGVSHTLGRHFFWSENIMWKEDLEGRDVTVLLTGRDLIVNTSYVGRYLTSQAADWTIEVNAEVQDETTSGISGNGSSSGKHPGGQPPKGGMADLDEWKTRPWKGKGIEVLWFEELDHGQIIDRPVHRKELVKVILKYCENYA